MSEWLRNPVFLYAVAFTIFVVLAFIYGRKPLADWLDEGIAQIRAELEQARQLRAEAEAALADCKRKQAAAEADAVAIVDRARQQVEQMRRQAEQDLAAALKRGEELTAQRIHLAETEAVAAVRLAAIELAMSMARKTLTEAMPADTAIRLIDDAVADIATADSNRAKAA